MARIMQGVYLNRSADGWFRSGKASRFYVLRDNDHQKGAKLTSMDSRKSRFYTNYPSKDSDVRFQDDMVCYFEETEMWCALGYKKADESTKYITNETGGLFYYTTEAKKSFGKCNNEPAKRDRRLLLIEYSIELAYELALSPSMNISMSLGFELWLKRKGSEVADDE